MKQILKDENKYPLNFDPSTYYQSEERYIPLSQMSNEFPDYYLVSTWGRIYNTKTGKFIPKELIPSYNRYVRVIVRNIYGQEINLGMHQVVAKLFIPFIRYPYSNEILCVNHKDGVKWHNEPYNLEWASLSENTIHADKNNLIERPYGEDNGHAALTDDQYRQICELTEKGYLPYQINQIMNLDKDITNIAQKIRSGKSETLISKEYNFSNIKRNDYRKFSEEQVRFICLCLQDHPEMKPIEILISLGYKVDEMEFKDIKKLKDTISTIKRRVSYIEIGKDYNF